MSKLYFADLGAEMCHPLEWHRDNMAMNGETTRTVYCARAIPTTHYFWCRAYNEVGESGPGNGCGAECGDYEPRNGRNGRCRHHSNCYEAIETETLVITI